MVIKVIRVNVSVSVSFFSNPDTIVNGDKK